LINGYRISRGGPNGRRDLVQVERPRNDRARAELPTYGSVEIGAVGPRKNNRFGYTGEPKSPAQFERFAAKRVTVYHDQGNFT